MIDFNMDVKGVEELRIALDKLPQNILKRVLSYGVREGAKPLRQALKDAAPIRKAQYGKHKEGTWKKFRSRGAYFRGPGFLKRKISYKRIIKNRSKSEVHYGIGPFGDAFYGYIVAHGHIVGSRKIAKRRGFSRTSRVPAYDFITPVFKAQYAAVVQKMMATFIDGILKEGEKAGFKKSYGWSFQ